MLEQAIDREFMIFFKINDSSGLSDDLKALLDLQA